MATSSFHARPTQPLRLYPRLTLAVYLLLFALAASGCLTVAETERDRVEELQQEYREAALEGRAPVVVVEDPPEVVAERERVALIEARAAEVRTVIPPAPVVYGAQRIPAGMAGDYRVQYDGPVASSYPLAAPVGVRPITDDLAYLVYDPDTRLRDSLFLFGDQQRYVRRDFDTRLYDRDAYTGRVQTALDLVDAATLGQQEGLVQVVRLPDGRTVVVQPVVDATGALVARSGMGVMPEGESGLYEPGRLSSAYRAGTYASEPMRTDYTGVAQGVGIYPGAIMAPQVSSVTSAPVSSVPTVGAPIAGARATQRAAQTERPSIARRITTALAPAASGPAVAGDPIRANGERRLSDLGIASPAVPSARVTVRDDLYAAPAYAPGQVPSTTNPTVFGDARAEPMEPVTSFVPRRYDLLSAPPADARAGECFARVYIPPQYSTTPRRVIVEDGGERLQVTAPEFASGQQPVIVEESGRAIEVRGAGLGTEATRSGVRIMPSYRTERDVVTVREPTERLDLIPPQYDIVTETVELRPAQQVWKPLTSEIYGLAVRDASGEIVTRLDGQTGEVLCLVEEPAEFATVERRVLRRPGSTRSVAMPGEYAEVERRVPNELSVREVETAAQVGFVPQERLVRPAQARRVDVPPQYAEIPVQQLEVEAQVGYVPVLCEVNFNSDRILELQDSLRALGIYAGPLDGLFSLETQQAVLRYQQDNGLPYGALTLETLDALGVRY
jgi:hypothetical protein